MPSEVLRGLRRGWPVLLSIPIVFATASLLISSAQPASQTVSVTLLTTVCIPVGVDGPCDYSPVGTEAAEDWAEVIRSALMSEPVMRTTSEALPQYANPVELVEAISVARETDSPIITFFVRAADAEKAVEIAATHAESIASFANASFGALSTTESPIEISVLSPPTVGAGPLTTSVRNAVLASIMGFLIALGVLVIRWYLNPLLRSSLDLSRKVGLKSLAQYRADQREFESSPEEASIAISAAVGAFLARPENGIDHTPRIAIVNSPPGANAAALISALARSKERSGHRCLVVGRQLTDAQDVMTEASTSIALSYVATSDGRALSALRHSTHRVVRIELPDDDLEANDALLSDDFAEMLRLADECFDLVLLDLKGERELSERLPAIARADAALLNVKLGTANARSVDEQCQRLEHMGVQLIGAVTTDSDPAS